MTVLFAKDDSPFLAFGFALEFLRESFNRFGADSAFMELL